MAIATGGFVYTEDANGIGKLASVANDTANIVIFRSIVHNTTASYSQSSVQRGYLSPQTRVYWRDPEREEWAVGRVCARVPGDGEVDYEVQFANKRVRSIPENELYTR